jgi:uncharacterized membrane protein
MVLVVVVLVVMVGPLIKRDPLIRPNFVMPIAVAWRMKINYLFIYLNV